MSIRTFYEGQRPVFDRAIVCKPGSSEDWKRGSKKCNSAEVRRPEEIAIVEGRLKKDSEMNPGYKVK